MRNHILRGTKHLTGALVELRQGCRHATGIKVAFQEGKLVSGHWR